MEKSAAFQAGVMAAMEKNAGAEALVPLAIHGLGGMVGHHYGKEQRKRGEKYRFGGGQVAGALLLPGGLGYQIGRYMGHHPAPQKEPEAAPAK